jgi:uncharacterized protein (DUF1778 family)
MCMLPAFACLQSSRPSRTTATIPAAHTHHVGVGYRETMPQLIAKMRGSLPCRWNVRTLGTNMASSKVARINLRTTPQQDRLIRRAAEAQRKSVSDFILESACRSAESALLDTKTLLLDRRGWEQLNKSLNRRAAAIPELVELFAEKAPWN